MFRIKVLVAAAVLALSPIAALAADVGAAAFPLKAPAIVTSPCTISNCSGMYAGFGLSGDGTSVDILGSGLNQSVFSAGGIIDVHAGYQLWNGTYFAAIEGGIGNEFAKAQPLNSFGAQTLVGYEIVKLGIGLSGLLGGPLAPSAPSQSPGAINLPATIAGALMSPYIAMGAEQRHGVSQWVTGAGAEFLLASHWNLDIRYLYAAPVTNLPSANIVTLGLNYHF